MLPSADITNKCVEWGVKQNISCFIKIEGVFLLCDMSVRNCVITVVLVILISPCSTTLFSLVSACNGLKVMDREWRQVGTGWLGLQDAEIQNTIALLATRKACQSQDAASGLMMKQAHQRQDGLIQGLMAAHGDQQHAQHQFTEQHQLQNLSVSASASMMRFAGLGSNTVPCSTSEWLKTSSGLEQMFGQTDVMSPAVATIPTSSGLGQVSGGFFFSGVKMRKRGFFHT